MGERINLGARQPKTKAIQRGEGFEPAVPRECTLERRCPLHHVVHGEDWAEFKRGLEMAVEAVRNFRVDGAMIPYVEILAQAILAIQPEAREKEKAGEK